MTSYDEGNLTVQQYRYLSAQLSTLLARVQEVLRIERVLEEAVEPGRVSAFETSEPVLAGHRAAELERHREHVPRGALAAFCLVGRDEEGRVDVAVARVPPGARLEAV